MKYLLPTLQTAKVRIFLALAIAINLADIASTYSLTPDLSAEWNPLQSQFQLGWAGLLIAKLIGTALAVIGYAYYLHFRKECLPRESVTFGSFCKRFAFGADVHWSHFIYGVPAKPHFGVLLGYYFAGMQAMIVWVVADNIGLHFGVVNPIRYTSEVGYHLVQNLFVVAALTIHLYRGNWLRYREAHSPKLSTGETSMGF